MITLSLILCGFSFLTGCVHGPIRTGWLAAKNRKVMVHVQPDMTIEEVTKVMGKPDKTELFRGKDNEPILVYLYFTEGKDLIRRRWNDSNYTPFVFINERL